ncbi:hypothetical protein ACFXDH_41835 [Streptomyces sp. NPDC059467]|uniref:hypothetical protein n=1 Tax=Streptomyces sp. NPDC059467 TaxID=3346844 RepID=UPI0036AD6237
MTATLVIGMQQQLGQLLDVSVSAGHMAGDRRGDPMPVFRHALTISAREHRAMVGTEPAVAASCRGSST